MPDGNGALQQTTGITCGPAAAAMLLHRAGIRISEGALAELASTSPLQGTAPFALARAVDRVARCRGMRGRVRRVEYEEAFRLARPFVAFVHRPGVGGHAVCVRSVGPHRVATLDPLSGTRDMIPRDQFVTQWDPVIVWVERVSR
jgi:ABC-type bacteriocin/lantibiotic exporter with double-glycine peptidase domain